VRARLSCIDSIAWNVTPDPGLVEVKTGSPRLDDDQVAGYLDLARSEGRQAKPGGVELDCGSDPRLVADSQQRDASDDQ
jgi:hypothetical protein